MQDFEIDEKLLQDFKTQVRATGVGSLRDPRWPFRATVARVSGGHLIKIEDIRKNWFGREVGRYKHRPEEESSIVDSGPAMMAIMMLEMTIGKKPG
ncbi:hypothetical protein LJR098_001061 [Rhizobium sp. LjRoot98]|uniref:hypothetical protein n=1 Tax=Rhizobium sp. LjRoot98 TaxID=3342345 RepID=UPI003ECDB767